MKKIYFIALLINLIGSAQTVTTLAGSGTAGSTDGTGTSATFNNPRDVAVDASGNIFVAGSLDNKIRKITPAGVVTTFAGSGTAGGTNGTGIAATFNNPYALEFNTVGDLFVAETTGQRIRKITPAGVVTTFAGSGTSGGTNGTGTAATFNGPSGLAFDSSGNLYVAEADGFRIRKITPAGVVTTFAGSGTLGSTDATGTAASFRSLYGLTFDSSGNLFAADYGNNKIRKITSAGVVTTFAGSGVAGTTNGTGIAATFDSPFGLTIDNNNNLYASDALGNKVRKITPAGVVTTVAGSGTASSVDGEGVLATFNGPRGISFDATYNNLYIAERNGNKIRKITLIITSPPTAASTQSFCGNSNVALLQATGTNLKWYGFSTGGTEFPSSWPISSSATYYVSQTVGGVESARTAVAVTINAIPATPISSSLTVSITGCTSEAGTYNSVGTANGKNKYQSSSDSNNFIEFNGTKWVLYVWSIVNSSFDNTSVPAGMLPPTTGWIPTSNCSGSTMSMTAGANSDYTFCNGATISNIPVTGSALKWYDALTNGNLLPNSTVLATGPYFVSQTVNNCESTRSQANITINPTPSSPTATSPQSVSNGDTIANLTATGSGLLWYATFTGGSPLATNTTLADNTTYYTSQTVGGCESSRTSVTAIFALSINNYTFNHLKTFPNPAQNKFTIAIQEKATATIYDIMGKQIMIKNLNTGENTIDISDLNKGMYLVKIENEKGSQTIKLVKE